jgi:thiol-disulfide isomerase/thioredoxin
MNKKMLLIGTAVFMLSCSTLFPQNLESVPQANSPQMETTPLVSGNEALIGFTEVRLHPTDGKLEEMLAVEAEKAVAAGLLPVVEFDADWCPPCQAIKQHLEAKNELMLKAYNGTYIIKLDVDEWGWVNGKVEYFTVEGIPVYFKLDEQGQPTGDSIDGGAWNEDIPVNIAPVMDKFFHGG